MEMYTRLLLVTIIIQMETAGPHLSMLTSFLDYTECKKGFEANVLRDSDRGHGNLVLLLLLSIF